MSHSYVGPSGREYHHDSEGSPDDVVHFEVGNNLVRGLTPARPMASITMEDIIWLAARAVRHARINELENMSDEDILGMPKE